jgi:polyhydroxyalkanoate synthesis regulator phasin
MMAKKKNQESQKEQSERFQKLVQDMVDAGELNPTETDENFSRVMDKIFRAPVKQNQD